MKKIPIILVMAMVLLLISGCQAGPQADIAATTMPMYDFTQALCQGTPLTVVQLITEEVSCVHDYTLTVSQMKAVEAVELVVCSGAGLEDFMEEALTSARNLVDASAGIALLEGECHHHHEEEEDGHGHGEGHEHEADPHIWLSPENAAVMARNICHALSRQYPQHRAVFEKNLNDLLSRIEEVAEYGKAQLSGLASREIITFHDGFGYLAQAFDLEILEAIEEESGSEPSAQELIGLIRLVEGHGVRAIFTETNGSSASAGLISAETGIPVYTLDMAMAGDGWFESMYHNIDTLKEALE